MHFPNIFGWDFGAQTTLSSNGALTNSGIEHRNNPLVASNISTYLGFE